MYSKCSFKKQKSFKKNFLVAVLTATDEKSRSQRYGSADQDPYQDVTDPRCHAKPSHPRLSLQHALVLAEN
jgi:hypothetical protein